MRFSNCAARLLRGLRLHRIAIIVVDLLCAASFAGLRLIARSSRRHDILTVILLVRGEVVLAFLVVESATMA